jgi:hypothetical protein
VRVLFDQRTDAQDAVPMNVQENPDAAPVSFSDE